jgi:hypothetical protein
MIIDDKEELEEQVRSLEEGIIEIKKLLLNKKDREVLKNAKEMITDSVKKKMRITRKLKRLK